MVTANSNLVISCGKSIKFGNNVLMGWDVTVIDGDGHEICDENNVVINPRQEILIGNDVWIAEGVTLLKKTEISNGSVIGAKSIVSKKFIESNVLIIGNPAKIVKRNITWHR